jgi:hypothetical protein
MIDSTYIRAFLSRELGDLILLCSHGVPSLLAVVSALLLLYPSRYRASAAGVGGRTWAYWGRANCFMHCRAGAAARSAVENMLRRSGGQELSPRDVRSAEWEKRRWAWWAGSWSGRGGLSCEKHRVWTGRFGRSGGRARMESSPELDSDSARGN